MKKLFLIVAAMFAVVSFSACSDDDDKDASIVGTWRHTREVGYEIYNGDKHEFDSTCSEANHGLILVKMEQAKTRLMAVRIISLIR